MKTVIRGIGQIVSGAIAAPLLDGDTIVCLDGKATKGRPHLGLGLSVARAVAARHGGEVHVTAGESGGATVVLRIPVRG